MADTKISALTAATTPLAGTEVLPIVQSGVTVKVAVSNLTAGRDIAATSLTTAVVQAASSAGGTLKNNSGTAQMQWGSGGGSNLSLEVATNINPANAAVNISPTGTGTVTINPATASTMNNVAIGGTTALAGRFTSVTATTGNFVVGTSGQGIDFSATPGTGTSELLNDYEEGTWTPTDASGAGLTLTVTTAKYTKIGRQVTVNCYIKYPVTSSTATALVTLPFTSTSFDLGTAAATSGNVFSGASIGTTNQFSFRTVSLALLTNASLSNADVLFTLTYQV
jgi:hypothetical protein